MDATALSGGFTDAPIQSAHAFRAVMTVLARPGQIETLAGAVPPAPLSVAAGALILTLCDAETHVHLAGACDTPMVRDWITFHTGAPFAPPASCAFAVGRWDAFGPLSVYLHGTPEYPDRSATLIVEVETLTPNGATLQGPGIQGQASLSLPEIAPFQHNAAQFPLGVDFFFTCGARVAGLPRSTKVTG